MHAVVADLGEQKTQENEGAGRLVPADVSMAEARMILAKRSSGLWLDLAEEGIQPSLQWEDCWFLSSFC